MLAVTMPRARRQQEELEPGVLCLWLHGSCSLLRAAPEAQQRSWSVSCVPRDAEAGSVRGVRVATPGA